MDTSAPAPPLPGGLEAWPDEAKRFYLALRARGLARTRSIAESQTAFGLVQKAQKKAPGMRVNMTQWEQREDVQVYLAWLKGEYKTDLKRLPFAQKWERIASQGNMVLVLLRRFEKEDSKGHNASAIDLVRLSGEIRQLYDGIRREVEGEGLDDSRVRSTWEEITEALQEIAAKSKHGDLLTN